MCAKRPNEWATEQGLQLDLTKQFDYKTLEDSDDSDSSADAEKADGIASEDPFFAFAEEKPGWRGYIEWEEYPEKKAKAAAKLAHHKFPPTPEFQLGPVPETNPILEGVRWKQWHRAVGGPLYNMPEESWSRVIEEKLPDMLHLLEFPYNGEPLKRLVTAKPITPTELHFVRNYGCIPNINAEAFELKLDWSCEKTCELENVRFDERRSLPSPNDSRHHPMRWHL